LLIRQLENEADIVQKCQNGDMSSFEAIYNHYQEPMLRVAFRMIGSREDTQDVLQMTFIKLYRGIKNFRHDARFSTYLFQILINVCYDFNRSNKRKNQQPIQENDLFYRPQNELQIQLEEAIQQLPDKMRECFILFAIEGFKQHEIAETLNVTVGTVKAHIFQAKEKLRKFLNQDMLQVT